MFTRECFARIRPACILGYMMSVDDG